MPDSGGGLIKPDRRAEVNLKDGVIIRWMCAKPLCPERDGNSLPAFEAGARAYFA